MALAALQAINELGFRCPEEISLAAVDDVPWANVIVPRLTCGLGGTPPGAAWGDTRLSLPPDASSGLWSCRLSGAVVQAADGTIALTEAMNHLPVAVLLKK